MLNLKNPDLFNNRELSWLQFNTRVLKQAQDESLPLLERLKFLAIYGTNLDEFYMIRIAGLKKLFTAGIIVSSADKLTPLQQLREIRKYLHQEQQVVEHCMNGILKKLEAEGISIKSYHEVNQHQKSHLNKYFRENIYPVIIPIAVDATHPFPHLNNLSFGLIVKLRDSDNAAIERFGIIRVPRVLERFIELDHGIYMPIESLVAEHVDELFPGYTLIKYASFRVTRNADMEIEEEEADDFLEILEEGLKLRRKGAMVRLEVGSDGDDEIINFFNRHTNVYKDDIFTFHTFLNLSSLWQIVSNKQFAHLLTEPFKTRTLPPLESSENIFATLEKQDVLLYHPYESFEPVVQLIQNAAKDPDVVSIKMTLYRSGTDSPIVKSLMSASESGKQVTVMVELKARFDEENNLIWAKALEKAGAHVIYGIKGFKVHAKATLITRKKNGKLKQYAHIGTGNYNPATSKIYTDMSYLTSKDEITSDMTRFFHFLTGFSKKGKLNELYMSPSQIKPKILSLIQNEARRGENGRIIAKLNSLVDDDVIRALYKASQAGVKIDLIVRGICCLKPGIEGVSENIRVISILGKYLEHARAFYFKNDEAKVYISSADWMPRNLTRRIELLTAIKDDKAREKILQILQLQCADNSLAHELQSDGSYTKVKSDGVKNINNHKHLEDYVNKITKAISKESASSVEQLTSRIFTEEEKNDI
ncbi:MULTISPECIES: RNA degradosome polyphosphate kinase [unclassified Sulfurimonas]|uniref:RNA degradosome polyphosphate kinase n=1 Tax=unclassified Sulfurimonas TaxID=2623549 RepID=UPI0008D32033|nr:MULTISPECIES: RNA degradosome polyphosphate kinase [unclassified Sulfurimonas]MBS4067655.1 RNA degradosome polyphosphate kinase [Sulfurimonas sp.]MDD3854286.1 RNA degradosome polyphosphate kinase [Sulfurimonas sp.]OHE05638.1 MAG: RNA degradosome polyphosphate kinase [Sulfurimonas sp. RIFOXYB12_FULL_35_9]